MIDLTGKVGMVTGASRGIGYAIAGHLYEHGADLALVDIDQEGVEQAARSFTGKGRTLAIAADVSSTKQTEESADQAESQLGPVDILVNNAGLTRDGMLVRMGEQEWDLVINVNLKGAFLLTKLMSRGMMKRRWGRIINVASVVGIIGNKGQANYAASKAGLIGLTKAVAKELASRNVLINAVAPGFIDTDMTKQLPESARQTLLEQIPLQRLGSAHDVADAVLFLASDLASYITGQVLVVDGGMVM
jgi:3-oxoacyl-[acyl-carrier protein] reductase